MNLKENIISLLQFNRWAEAKLLEAIPESVLDLEINSSFNSIRKTVCHSWDAETIWFERIQDVPVTPWPASAQFHGTWAEMKQAILRQEDQMIAYFSEQPESYLLGTISYKNLKGLEFTNTIFQVLQHVVNHSTMHRGQLVTQLRQAGVASIPSTDLIAYYREINGTA